MQPERQEVLDQISKMILLAVDQQTLLDDIANQIVPSLGDYCRIAVIDEKKHIKDVVINHINPTKIALVAELYQRYDTTDNTKENNYGVTHILKTGKPELISLVESNVLDMIKDNKPLQEVVRKLEIKSYMGVPLIAHEKVIGTIIVTSTQPDRYFSYDDLGFLEEIARRVALKLENINLFRQAQQEIVKRKRAERTIKRIAYHDPLTHLPNRILFYKHAEKAIIKSKRFAILFLDVNGFKDINDIFGHDIGDKILVQLAKKFKAILKTKGIVSRFGGDEFTFMLNEIETKSDVKKFIAKIIESLKAPIVFDEHAFYISISIGISLFPEDGIDLQTLLKRADISMYYAKRSARINYSFYNKKIKSKNAYQLEFENYLRNAIIRNEFEMYYQPIIDIRTNEITSAEALIRWHHPKKGLLLPKDFLRLADEIGLSFIIDLWVLKTVYNQRKEWEKTFPGHIPRVSINISSGLFKQKHFLSVVRRFAKDTSFGDAIQMEITEGTLMENTEENIRLLTKLRELNIPFAIDDFGTGYSSLSYLKSFPINKLKIDISFVRNIENKQEDRLIIKSIISLAKNLKMKIIAEGVETQKQFAFLKKNRCDEIQGYLVNPPLSAKKYFALLQSLKSSN